MNTNVANFLRKGSAPLVRETTPRSIVLFRNNIYEIINKKWKSTSGEL